MRQTFFNAGLTVNYSALDKAMQTTDEYRQLPAKLSQWVLKDLSHNWKVFFEALQEWQIAPAKFLGRPKPPKYKAKLDGPAKLTYTMQTIGKKDLREGAAHRQNGQPD